MFSDQRVVSFVEDLSAIAKLGTFGRYPDM